MKNKPILIAGLLCTALLLPGCATYIRHGLDQAQAQEIEKEFPARKSTLSRETEARILALDPTHVTAADIAGPLSQAPAPRIINIHGGIYPVHLRMISFSEFLVGMGYPRKSVKNRGDGTYTFSCYESSDTIAGMIAWYYEHEGLPPIIVGHSQGGFQAVKILRKFAGLSAKKLEVWNPLTWKPENRFEITDPLSGRKRPVVGLKLGYTTVVGTGGLTRILPNQWDIDFSLRSIPDSVEEFTGFYNYVDLLGGDFLGFGPTNNYHSMGSAKVRTVRLPTKYRHGGTPDTKHLLASQQIRDWINNYRPNQVERDTPKMDEKFDSDSANILWAADVWYSIKKHWVLELQRSIRARRSQPHGD